MSEKKTNRPNQGKSSLGSLSMNHVNTEDLLELLSDNPGDISLLPDWTGRSLTNMDCLSPTERIRIASERKECFFTEEDIKVAAKEAIRGHIGKWQIDDFLKEFDARCHAMYVDLCNGTWWEKCSYTQIDRTNTNGKRRHIDSPNLYLRILEHLWLLYIVPLFDEENIKVGVARNCLPDHGITAKRKEYSVVGEMKELFYDRREYNYLLTIDQRKCYPHITPKLYRKAIKELTRNKFLIDFGEKVSFVNNKLPIGTPTSPYIHNIVMLPYDKWMKSNTEWCLRYADDNAIAFRCKEDAQEMKWRIQNYWWYNQQIRAKSMTMRVMDMNKETIDFCGYIMKRHPFKRRSDHNKGITFIRKETLNRAFKNKKPEAWGSYFGIMRHGDTFNLILEIERTNMDFAQLSNKIKIDREMDAPEIAAPWLAENNITFHIFRFKVTLDGPNNEPGWCKCLIGIPSEDMLPDATGKLIPTKVMKFSSFNGQYKYLSKYLHTLETMYYPVAQILPLENVQIEDNNGLMFKNSTHRLTQLTYDQLPQAMDVWRNEQLILQNEHMTNPDRTTPEQLAQYNTVTGQNLVMKEKKTAPKEILPGVSRAGYKNSYRRKQ